MNREEERKLQRENRPDGNTRHTPSRPEWQSAQKLRMTDVVFALRKHILLIVICTIIGLVAGVCLSVLSYLRGEINKQYAISTAIAVTSQNKDGLFTAKSSNNPDSSDIYLAENMVDSVIFVLKSDRTLEAAVERLELLGVATKDIAKNLEMNQYNETQVIEITLYWRSAQEGVEILNAINEVGPSILIDTLKIGGVSVINKPSAKYMLGGNVNASLWLYMMLLGCMFAMGFAVLELLLRPTLLSSKDMEKNFSMEVLAEIPNRRGYFRKKRNLLMEIEEDEANFDIIDNYTSLAHILKTKVKEMDHVCIYVTSAAKNEGKTTVTSRLAVQLAEQGNKVLMIDFDTRNPKLGGLFLNKVEYEHSVNALYRGETTKEDAVTHLTGKLDILPAILERKALPLDEDLFDMIESLKAEYDMILMDTAPVGQVADTMSLNHLADIALLVVRFDGASLESIREALARLDKSGTQMIGCVVNAVKKLGGRNYGYGYGYYAGSKSTKKRQKSDQEKEWEAWEKEQESKKKYFDIPPMEEDSKDD